MTDPVTSSTAEPEGSSSAKEHRMKIKVASPDAKVVGATDDEDDDLFGDGEEVGDESPVNRESKSMEVSIKKMTVPADKERAPATPKPSTSSILQESPISPKIRAPIAPPSLISSIAPPALDPTTFGLPSSVKIPKSVTSSLLYQGKLLETMKNLPVNLINDALVRLAEFRVSRSDCCVT